jgi:hypothetical protein
VTGFYDDGSEFCKVNLDASKNLVIGADCLYAIEFTGGPRSGMSGAFQSTSAYIEVQKGLIRASASEQALLVALFHELGHYYRSHLSVPSDRLNYFYYLDKAHVGQKPPADPALADLTTEVRKKMQANLINRFQQGFDTENQQVVSERLGFYTIEEEADKFGLETLAMMGFDPGIAVQTILDLGAIWEKERGGPAPGEMSAAACQALANAGWKDVQGNPVVVPLGNLADLHHSPCFRAFNMAREVQAGFTVDTSTTYSPPGGSWTMVQRSF